VGPRHGAQRLSLAFAAFPEIFNDRTGGRISSLLYTSDPSRRCIDRSSNRYTATCANSMHSATAATWMASLTQVLPLLVVLLSLES